MFVVNQSGTLCEQAEKIEKEFKENEEYQKELDRISSAIYRKYCYLPVGKKQSDIDSEIKESMENTCMEPEFCQIKINGIVYGEYNRENGDYIFEQILDGISRNELLIDLRRFDE